MKVIVRRRHSEKSLARLVGKLEKKSVIFYDWLSGKKPPESEIDALLKCVRKGIPSFDYVVGVGDERVHSYAKLCAGKFWKKAVLVALAPYRELCTPYCFLGNRIVRAGVRKVRIYLPFFFWRKNFFVVKELFRELLAFKEYVEVKKLKDIEKILLSLKNCRVGEEHLIEYKEGVLHSTLVASGGPGRNRTADLPRVRGTSYH